MITQDLRTLKWMRGLRLLVGQNGNGDVSPSTGLLIENLRIQFEFTKTIYRTPNVATIRVYNMTQEHEQVVRKEFNDLILEGGYQADRRLFFRGNIKYTAAYREGNDRICEIAAGDGDKDFRNALVNFSLASGHDDADTIRKLTTSMQATTLGEIRGKRLHERHGRGRVFSGSMRDLMDKIADHNAAHWSIQDGKIILIPVDETRANEALEVSSETGLLGAPMADEHGISIQMLFDPRAVPGAKLWLKNNEVKRRHLKAQIHKARKGKPQTNLREDPDGIYKIYSVSGAGDTRDASWSCTCKCVALDAPIPPAKGVGVTNFTSEAL